MVLSGVTRHDQGSGAAPSPPPQPTAATAAAAAADRPGAPPTPPDSSAAPSTTGGPAQQRASPAAALPAGGAAMAVTAHSALRGVASPEELYEHEGRAARSELEQLALEKLREWDEQCEASFSALQAVELVRALKDVHETDKEQPLRRRPWSGLVSFDCVLWAAIVALLLMAPVLLAASLTQEVKADSSGVLLALGAGAPAAAAPVVSRYGLAELPTLPEAVLRRIRGCAFAHRGASHQIRVASLVRGSSGDVRVGAPDGSRIIIKQSQGQDALDAGDRNANETDGGSAGSIAKLSVATASFFRPFFGEEPLDLTEASSDPTWQTGCSFTLLTQAPERARPLQ